MGSNWQLWLTSGVIAAIVAGIVNLPKVLGEGRKADAEADGARFATYRTVTDATIAELKADCKRCQDRLNARDELDAAREARIMELEKRERTLAAALRTLVRAQDADDPTQLPAAIAAAKLLT